MKKTSNQGGCGCGATRFTASNKPKFVAVCHCTDCRAYTGAVFSTFAGFLDENIQWSGRKPNSIQSSKGVIRKFCGLCGTPLSYQGENWDGETHIYLGTFDDPESLPIQGPPGEVFEHEKLSWIKL